MLAEAGLFRVRDEVRERKSGSEGPLVALFAAASAPQKTVAVACYGLVQYSRFLPRTASVVKSCRRRGAETATNLRPTT